jgi:hypothetical protein
MNDSTSGNPTNGAPHSEAVPEPEPSPTAQEAADGTRQKLRRLPPEVGAVLIAAGVAGILLPGPIGTPLLLAGGLALLPGVFGRAERWFERRYPTFHGEGMRYVDRFIDDLEKRFPPDDLRE